MSRRGPLASGRCACGHSDQVHDSSFLSDERGACGVPDCPCDRFLRRPEQPTDSHRLGGAGVSLGRGLACKHPRPPRDAIDVELVALEVGTWEWLHLIYRGWVPAGCAGPEARAERERAARRSDAVKTGAYL